MAFNVYITGASSGIGAHLAYECAKKGFNISLVARREDRLNQVKDECLKINPDIKVLIYKNDVRNQNEIIQSLEDTANQFGSINMVIANAGYAVTGSFESLSIEDFKTQFDTNIFGLLNTLKPAIKYLKKSKGHIGVLSSVAGYCSFPGGSAYTMSKFAVRSLGECLNAELSVDGISTTVICPGFVDSEIYQIGNNGKFQGHRKTFVPKFLILSTQKAASQILNAIINRKREAIITGHGKFVIFFQRHWPWVVNQIFKWGFKKWGQKYSYLLAYKGKS